MGVIEARRRILLSAPHPVTTTPDPIATFSTDMVGKLKSAKFGFSPVQDLHGYDYPWPAGGGKNLFNGSNVVTSYSSNWEVLWDGNTDTLTITHKTSYTTGTPSVTIPLPEGDYVSSFESRTENASSSLYVNGTYVKILNDGTTFTVSNGDTVSVMFSASQDATNVITKFQIEKGSAKTPYAPYSNICPISGRTGATVSRTGVNLWDEEWESGYYLDNGTPAVNSNRIRCKNRIGIKPSTTYYVYAGGSSNYEMYVVFYDSAGAYVGKQLLRNVAFTTNGNVYSALLYVVGVSTYNHDISINYPATDHDYHPYTGTTLPVTFPASAGTVYGGYVDLVNGKLVVDRAEVDLGTLDYALNNHATLGQYFYANVFGLRVRRAGDYPSTIYPSICSAFKCVSRNASVFVNGTYCFDGDAVNVTQVQFKDSAYSDATTFKAAMSGVQLVYELATPITYQLTPQEIKTLRGTNNIWSNANGDTQVAYWTHRDSQVIPIPSIIAQPQNAFAARSSIVELTVEAENVTSYQWQWKAINDTTWANLAANNTAYPGGTTKTVSFELTPQRASASRHYRCVLTNSAGSVITNVVSATIDTGENAYITTQPKNAMVALNDNAIFHVVAHNASSYTWQLNNDGSWRNCGAVFTDRYTDTLTVPMSSSARNGWLFRCAVTGIDGTTIYSDTAMLILAP